MNINLNQLLDQGPTNLVKSKIKDLPDGHTLCGIGIQK